MNYIDLGLPSGTLWADCNIGANKPQEFGDYFNFYDAQNYGTVPTKWQIYELINYAVHVVCKVEDVDGMCFIGKNGNSIFMPFAGYIDSLDRHYETSSFGYWWSCIPTNGYNAYIFCLDDANNVNATSYCNRTYDFSTRLVKIKQ